MNRQTVTSQASVNGRLFCVWFLMLTLALALPKIGLAVPIVGAPIIVATDGQVIATYRGNTAAFSDDLFLDMPAGVFPGLIFNNHASRIGSMINLGSFTAGTELVFRLHVRDFLRDEEIDFFSGLASRNPDGKPHARVDGAFSSTETLVEFEDLFGTPEFPRGFNDLSFSFTNVRTIEPVSEQVPEPPALLLLGTGLILLSHTCRLAQDRSMLAPRPLRTSTRGRYL